MTTDDRATATPASGARLQDVWWGEFPFEVGTWGHWRVGPVGVWVGQSEHDWQIAYARDESPFRDESSVELPVDLQRVPLPPNAEQHRVGYTRTPGVLELRPMLADRAIVARPESTFSIPSLERVKVYVSSSVWIGLSSGPQRERLIEIPAWRSSDTWFGDNRSGFLCYATRSAMRLNVDDLPPRPHRVVTPILIDNQGTDTLKIERLSLPIPNLSVFASTDGALWTERLQLTRKDDAELADVHIDRDNPPAPGAVRVSEPRVVAEDKLISRVFTGLFG